MEIFRTFEYNGKVLQLAAYEPESSGKPRAVKAPGSGKFEIGPINLSSGKVALGEAFTLTARVTGKNIAFIYTDILFYDKDLNQLYGPVARGYIQAEQNRESRGVTYPDWDDVIRLTLTLTPSLRLLTDGVDSAFGFLLPEDYGNSDTQIGGLYTSVDKAAQRTAQISFDEAGEIKKMESYKKHGALAMPHALTPEEGDQFTPFVEILTPPTNENPAWQVTRGLSTPLTFRGQPLRWKSEPLLPGEYWAGLLVQDLDGGLTRKYAPLIVSE